MDEITDSIGQLSTSAKEWRPGTAFETPSLPQNQRHTSSSQTLVPSAANHPVSPQPSYRPSVMHHSPPGRNVTDRATSADWQLQPRGDWKSGSTKEFVPGNMWSNHQAKGTTQHSSVPPLSPPQGNRNLVIPESNNIEDVNSWWHRQQEHSTVQSGPSTTPRGKSLHSLGLSDDLWQFYRDIAVETQREIDPADPQHKAVPPNFLNAFPLDYGTKGTRSSFGYPTSVFKVVSKDDGRLYCLRRLDNVRSVSYKIAAAVTERWTKARNMNTGASAVEHPGLVRFYRSFLSNRAVFFLHDYIPGARTLRQRFMDPASGGGVPLPEPLIWSCITQLVSTIRMVHGANLALRSLQLNHILCTTPNWGWGGGDHVGHLRLRINCIGVVDALEFEARKGLVEIQGEDLNDLGRIILSLGTGTEISRNSCDRDTLRRCDAFLSQNYSPSLHGLAMSLVRTTNIPSISDVSSIIAGRVFDELDHSHTIIDRTDSLLASEYDSGRALRLLMKLGFINERPEFGMNRRWTESGDCYVLKLFRDYVFHQADEAGHPIMDLGHVVTALNKLDAADEEEIVLSSRDGKSLLIVSYADVSRCLDSAFSELCIGSVNHNPRLGR